MERDSNPQWITPRLSSNQVDCQLSHPSIKWYRGEWSRTTAVWTQIISATVIPHPDYKIQLSISIFQTRTNCISCDWTTLLFGSLLIVQDWHERCFSMEHIHIVPIFIPWLIMKTHPPGWESSNNQTTYDIRLRLDYMNIIKHHRLFPLDKDILSELSPLASFQIPTSALSERRNLSFAIKVLV